MFGLGVAVGAVGALVLRAVIGWLRGPPRPPRPVYLRMLDANRTPNGEWKYDWTCEICDSSWTTRFDRRAGSDNTFSCTKCGIEHTLSQIYNHTQATFLKTKQHDPIGDGNETD